MLYKYGIKLGLKLLLRGKLKQSARYLIKPVDYWRNLEFQLVYREADFKSSDTILDIGSPKLLSLYLADKLGAEVFSTDIDDYFVKEYTYLRDIENISPGKFHIKIEDGRNLSFNDNFFTKIYSISVIEHIPESGDSKCLKEIRRVLAKGGICVITVPFSPISKVEHRDSDFYWANSSTMLKNGKIFFMRRYSEEDLYKRLIDPSKLILKKISYIGENILVDSRREISDFLPRISGPIQPLLSKLFHSKSTSSWKNLKKPLCALIVLEK